MQTNCQWIERTLRHESGGEIPYNFMLSPPAQQRAESHYGTDLVNTINLPMRMNGPKAIKPLYADPKKYGPTIRDHFGVVWTTSEIDRGAPIGPCLREATLADYHFPDPRDESRFEDIAAWCAQNKDHFRVIWVGDLWERATFMRGMGEILLDVAINRGFVEALLDGLTASAERMPELPPLGRKISSAAEVVKSSA